MITILITIALLGYLLVIFESSIKINKTITAILTGALCWITIAVFNPGKAPVISEKLIVYFGEISGLLIFLLGAMTIVELIDLNKGFTVITHRIRTKSVFQLLWIVGFVTFGLSALLDNLATAIIMIALLKKLMPKGEIRMILAGIVVIRNYGKRKNYFYVVFQKNYSACYCWLCCWNYYLFTFKNVRLVVV